LTDAVSTLLVGVFGGFVNTRWGTNKPIYVAGLIMIPAFALRFYYPDAIANLS
jgi:hypothetical protein